MNRLWNKLILRRSNFDDMNDSVSVIIPAYNEEGDIERAIKIASRIILGCKLDYEIIVVDDGSTDGTGQKIAKCMKKNRRIKVVTHEKNQGFGQTIRDGIKAASKTYITGFPADIDFSLDTLKDIVSARNKADVVSTYMTNLSKRPLVRKIISTFFIKLMNLIFRLNLKYYNGYFICRGRTLKKLKLRSSGFTIFAEAKIRLCKSGASFAEIPFENRPRLHGVSKALTWKSLIQTIQIIPILIKDIYFK